MFPGEQVCSYQASRPRRSCKPCFMSMIASILARFTAALAWGELQQKYGQRTWLQSWKQQGKALNTCTSRCTQLPSPSLRIAWSTPLSCTTSCSAKVSAPSPRSRNFRSISHQNFIHYHIYNQSCGKSVNYHKLLSNHDCGFLHFGVLFGLRGFATRVAAEDRRGSYG